MTKVKILSNEFKFGENILKSENCEIAKNSFEIYEIVKVSDVDVLEKIQKMDVVHVR